MGKRRQDQLGPTLRASFEGTRLSARHVAEAYERLVPVSKRRLATRVDESVRHDAPAPDQMGMAGARRQPC
jgi:hypothetical protein